jgi:hypothetical protein
MNTNFFCPHCQAMLNPESAIILLASNAGKRMLLGLHPEPGNYEVYLPDGVVVERGSVWDFACPVCHNDLAAAGQPNLCALDLKGPNESHKVFFSRVAGEHATYVVNSGGVVKQLGDAAKTYSLSTLKYMF